MIFRDSGLISQDVAIRNRGPDPAHLQPCEADKIVVCLSRSSGLIRGVAKNCRKLKNRFGASLEPFTLITLTYFEEENQELVSFSQTEILRSRFNLSSDAAVMPVSLTWATC